uniref:Uncharacterized protein n=1 Tax=Knipowitschia caucasica TaxID=637954 RepID=A0AAV2L4H2_KNICA
MAKRSGSYKKYLEDGTERIPKRTRNRWKLAKRRKEAVPNEENNEDDDSLQNVVIHDKNFTENEDEENSSTGSQEIKEYPSESEMDMFDVDSIEDENVETEDLDFNAKENAPQSRYASTQFLIRAVSAHVNHFRLGVDIQQSFNAFDSTCRAEFSQFSPRPAGLLRIHPVALPFPHLLPRACPLLRPSASIRALTLRISAWGLSREGRMPHTVTPALTADSHGLRRQHQNTRWNKVITCAGWPVCDGQTPARLEMDEPRVVPSRSGPTPLTQCMPVQPRREVRSGSQRRAWQQLLGHLQRERRVQWCPPCASGLKPLSEQQMLFLDRCTGNKQTTALQSGKM